MKIRQLTWEEKKYEQIIEEHFEDLKKDLDLKDKEDTKQMLYFISWFRKAHTGIFDKHYREYIDTLPMVKQ
jgi:hypothetical protein